MCSTFIKILFFIFTINYVSSQYSGCDFYQKVKIGRNYKFASTHHPQNDRSTRCRWFYETSYGYKLSLKCDVNVPWVRNFPKYFFINSIDEILNL